MGSIAIVMFVHRTFAAVSCTNCNVKNLSFSLVVPTCYDTVRNANETGVDCGGWCAPQKRCDDSMGCNGPYDCMSDVCTQSICQGISTNL